MPGNHPYARQVNDLIPGLLQSDAPLAPGQSRTIAFGVGAWPAIAYTNTAVIYADGSAAGDQALIGAVLKIRAAEYKDLAEALAIVANAQSDPQLADHFQGLIDAFSAREASHRAAATGGPLPARDRVCESALATLQQQRRYPTLETQLHALAVLNKMFSDWATKLGAGPSAMPPPASRKQ